MKRVGSAVWLFSLAIALTTHGAAVLTFAALLHDPMGVPQSHIQVASLTALSTTPVSETNSEKEIAANSEPAASPLQPVSTNDAVLAETSAEPVIEAQGGSPEIAEQSSAKRADPVAADLTSTGMSTDTSLSETPTDPIVDAAPASSDAIAELTETPAVSEQSSSANADPVATTVTRNEMNPVASSPEMPTVLPVEKSPSASESISEQVDTQTISEASASSVAEHTEQTNKISAVETGPQPSDNSKVAADTVVTEVPAGSDDTILPESAVGETATSSSLNETTGTGTESNEPPVELALVVPRVTPNTEQPQPDPPKPADVQSLVAGFEGGSCFLAVPEQDPARKWLVRSYGAAPARFDLLDAHLQKSGAKDVSLSKRTIQDLQCGAIDLAKSFASKTNDRFKIAVHGNLVQDGGELNVLVAGFDQKWLYLTMVDDDGVATDISRFAKVEGQDVRLTMPVHIKNAGKFRSQLLLAVSSDKPLTLLDMPKPRPFAEVLPLIKGNIIAAKANVVIAIADFSVE